MSLVFPAWHYGFTVTTGSNDALTFVTNVTTWPATLNAGTYTPAAYATEVQRAMQAASGLTTLQVAYSYVNKAFTLSYGGAGVFQLLFGTGANNATSCGTMLGFTRGGGGGNDKTGATTYTGAATGVSPSIGPNLWTGVEPLDWMSPATATADTAPSGAAGQIGNAATFTQRSIYGAQNTTLGAGIDSVFFGSLKRISISYNALLATGSPSENTNMETFLNWITLMNPFAYQPNKTVDAAIRLVADYSTVQKINSDWAWLTRAELSYGRIAFLEDTSR